MNATFKFLARTGRRIRSYLGKLIKPLVKNGRFTIKLTLSIPLIAKIEVGGEWSKKPR
ncbi:MULTISPECIES: hypothetical protein [Agrobacterium]|uniref:Uncharacterized protein n=1 Tax=Agrobacterium larrymoorei TaxID=160699 RepID=A0ABX8THY1_9HYPH|nr:hypothetical protein [Agrobacterium larrymoorei]NSZ10074.1 hypothetical protein [Agrobacterium tumefaciens]QYA10805.1 hypothetical protein J5285_25970 [Agrobacterium larrymoorei]